MTGARGRADLRIEGPMLLDGKVSERAVMLVAAGRVQWVGLPDDAPPRGAARVISAAPDELVVPGYVDLHVHGGGGHDVADGTPEALEAICLTHARHGTAALCPTVLSSPPEVTLRALQVIRAATRTRPGGGARVLGAHLEGPFLNPARAGAQQLDHIHPPDLVLLEELLDAAGPTLRLVTLAPELPGALYLVDRLRDAGVVVAMGHSDATHAQALAAVEAGCRLATHTCNAMRGLHHREAGLLGATLLERLLVAEVIADGHHVSAPVLDLIWRLKGPDRLALITDATAAVDCPGQARLGDQPVSVTDGAVRLPDGTLAGSALTMDRAVANLARATQATVEAVIPAATTVPAAVLGEAPGPTLRPGSRADLLLLDAELRPREVILDGAPLPSSG